MVRRRASYSTVLGRKSKSKSRLLRLVAQMSQDFLPLGWESKAAFIYVAKEKEQREERGALLDKKSSLTVNGKS